MPLVRQLEDQLEYPGNLRATDTVQVRARVAGYLEQIFFTDGQVVAKGDDLFLIDPEPYEVALASAVASLRKAQAALGLAQAELERTKPLVKRGAVSAQELDLKEADVETATADVDAAEAARRQAQLSLSYTRITAPISGRLGRHLVDVGNLVEAQTTVLTTIESHVPIHAYFSISENDVQLMRPTPGLGTSAGMSDGGAARVVQLGLPGEQDYPFQGTLDFTQLGVDSSTGTQMRRAIFANQDEQLEPGMYVRIRVPIGGLRERLLVPERAVGVDQRGEYVLVVNTENVVEYRAVGLGTNFGGMRVVQLGVEANDRVVVNGLQRARPGATVVPVEAGELPGVVLSLLGRDGRASDPAAETAELPAAATSGEEVH